MQLNAFFVLQCIVCTVAGHRIAPRIKIFQHLTDSDRYINPQEEAMLIPHRLHIYLSSGCNPYDMYSFFFSYLTEKRRPDALLSFY